MAQAMMPLLTTPIPGPMRVLLFAVAAGLLAIPSIAPAQPTLTSSLLYDVWGCSQGPNSALSNMCFTGGVEVNYYDHGGGNELFFNYLRYGTITPNGEYIFGFFGAKLTTATMHFTDGSTFDFLSRLPDHAECQQPYPQYAPTGFYQSCAFLNDVPIALPGATRVPLTVSYVDIAAEIDEGYDLDDGQGGWAPAIGGRTFRSNVYSVTPTGFVTPEPTTVLLVGGGLLILASVSLTKRRA